MPIKGVLLILFVVIIAAIVSRDTVYDLIKKFFEEDTEEK